MIYICIYICTYDTKKIEKEQIAATIGGIYIYLFAGVLYDTCLFYIIYIYLCAWSCWNIGTVKANG